ncbi:hypothetical protein TKK_0005207 [Trichogramma kaykai]|uniref:MYND-type domain-containing protein n=1 Tax=Trichogramma kaykai TaxID=54128 RepID=A0ABD2XJT0_9HYME
MTDFVDLGFAVECEEPWLLESRFFPSKVGGKPAWLSLKNIPNSEKLACDYCKEPTVFLCQIYAPYEKNEKAFHRTIFVFICKNSSCCKDNSNGNLKIFRSQLERENEFYPAIPPVEECNWRTDLRIENLVDICFVCGIAAPYKCSKCKKVKYCSQLHQVSHWKNGHKASCGTEAEELSLEKNKFLFPEFELDMEEEVYSEKSDTDVDVAGELKKIEELKINGQISLQSEENVDEDLLKMANGEVDKTLLKFKKRIQNAPDQVIRYNLGGQPLFVSSSDQPSEIPNCENCNSARQFEFQIMPQLLTTLKIDSSTDCIHWGTIAIYTCKNSCEPIADYVPEFAWKQE